MWASEHRCELLWLNARVVDRATDWLSTAAVTESGDWEPLAGERNDAHGSGDIAKAGDCERSLH